MGHSCFNFRKWALAWSLMIVNIVLKFQRFSSSWHDVLELSHQDQPIGKNDEHYDLPVMPEEVYLRHAIENAPGVWAEILEKGRNTDKRASKRIPNMIWQTWKVVPSPLPDHTQMFIKKNPSWDFHAMDDSDCQLFMDHFFSGTSVLWAYNIVNHQLGAMKADIWRYAVLYVYGGMYIDSDSTFDYVLDSFVKPDDGFIFGREGNPFVNSYREDFYLGENASFNKNEDFLKRVGLPKEVILQWILLSEPRHAFMRETLANVVTVVRHLYLGEAAVAFKNLNEKKIMLVFTTGPCIFTVSIRKALWDQEQKKMNSSKEADSKKDKVDVSGGSVYRFVDTDFAFINGQWKVDFTPTFSKTHEEQENSKRIEVQAKYWVQEVEKEEVTLLNEYADSKLS